MPPKNLNNAYTPPTAPQLTPIIICGIVMALCALPSPGYTHLRWIQTALFYFLYGAHFIETLIFTQRLSKHGIAFGSAAWMKWVGTCFVGGKFCFEHFDRLVKKA
jgi:hypothetical protein